MTIHIRATEARDLGAISGLAGMLVRQHHDFDPERFFLAPNIEAGYRTFFARELESPDALILSAELDGVIVGYAFARLEPRNWNDLLDSCGVLHDLFVSEQARRRGVARQLLESVRERLSARGAPRLVLHTASRNAGARAFFAELGFRETMIELTAEL